MNLHPNRKYPINEEYFDLIDTEEKAYWLGWIASDGHLSKTNSFLTLALQPRDKEILENFRSTLNAGDPKYPIRLVRAKYGDVNVLTLSSKHLVKCLKQHLGIPYDIGAKDRLVKFPNLATDQIKWAFLRGLFEGDGSVSNPLTKKKSLVVSITSSSDSMKSSIQEFFGQRTPKEIDKTSIRWCGRNAIDFLRKIYAGSHSTMRLERKYSAFCEWENQIKNNSYGFGTFHHKREFSFVDANGTVHSGCGIKEFATAHGLNNSRLCDILNGKRKKHKGFSLPESKG